MPGKDALVAPDVLRTVPSAREPARAYTVWRLPCRAHSPGWRSTADVPPPGPSSPDGKAARGSRCRPGSPPYPTMPFLRCILPRFVRSDPGYGRSRLVMQCRRNRRTRWVP